MPSSYMYMDLFMIYLVCFTDLLANFCSRATCDLITVL